MSIRILAGRCGVALAALAASLLPGAAAQAEDVFRIGGIAELSGKYVAYGSQVKRGIETAIAVWKSVRGDKVAGRSIEVVIRDVQSNNSLAVSVMNQLIQSDKATVIIGPGGSDVGAAVVPAWKKTEERPVWLVPGVSSTVVEKNIGKDEYFFHTFSWTYDYHETNVDMLKRALGPDHTVAIIYADDAYGRAHLDYARKYLKEAGFKIVDEELVRAGANDFMPTLVKLRAMHPQIVYTLMQTDDAVLIAKQIRAAKLDPQYLIGTAQAILPEWRSAVGDIQECWTGVATWLPGLGYPADKTEPKLFPASATWETDWRQRNQREAEFMDAGAYVSTMLALLAVEKANSTDRDKIEKALAEGDYMTPLGESKFVPSELAVHQAFSKMVVFQLQKGADGFKSVLLYPADIAQGKLQSCPTE